VKFINRNTKEEQTLSILFKNELARASLNSSEFDFDCFSR